VRPPHIINNLVVRRIQSYDFRFAIGNILGNILQNSNCVGRDTYLRCQVRGRAKGAETVSMKFNRLFTETKRSYTRPRHFRYFASQEVSTADPLLNAQS
jgi:hypothetical protein